MSYQDVDAVLEHSTTTDSARLIMIAIARHTDKDGGAFPKYPRIHQVAGVSLATIKRYLNPDNHKYQLPADEICIVPGRGRGQGHYYIILVGCDPEEKRRRLEAALDVVADDKRPGLWQWITDYMKKGIMVTPFTCSQSAPEKGDTVAPIQIEEKGIMASEKVSWCHEKGITVTEMALSETAPASPEPAESDGLIDHEPVNNESINESMAASRPQTALEAMAKLCFGVPFNMLVKQNQGQVIIGLQGRKTGSARQQRPALREIQGSNGKPLTPEITPEMLDRDFRLWWFSKSYAVQEALKNGGEIKSPAPAQVRPCWRDFARWLHIGKPGMTAIAAAIPDWYALSESNPAGLARRVQETQASKRDDGMMQAANPAPQDPPIPAAQVVHVDPSIVAAKLKQLHELKLRKAHGITS